MENRNEDIKAIREMMEKSSKFLSLSGMSGVVAGTVAILGVAAGYCIENTTFELDPHGIKKMFYLLLDALAILVVALAGGFWFSWRKAKKSGQPLFNKVTYRILYSLAVPLVAGGLFCLIFLWNGDLSPVISGTLVFYGLALVNASKYTYGEIHYLGLTEIVLGLAAAIFGRYGIVFWTLGFGVCHIVYGLVMYMKYDRQGKK